MPGIRKYQRYQQKMVITLKNAHIGKILQERRMFYQRISMLQYLIAKQFRYHQNHQKLLAAFNGMLAAKFLINPRKHSSVLDMIEI